MTRRDIITAVPVAFAADGSLDLEGSREILRFVAASGNEGAFVLGTTGEFPALSLDERAELARISVEELGATMRVIVHVGAASLYEVRQLIASARAAGATEIAVLTPYYLPSGDASLYEFFSAVADLSEGLDVYLYVFRARTGNFVSAELMARLAQLPHVVGAKISGEDLAQVAAYRAVVPEGFVLYTGSDRDLVAAAEVGAQGVVSGVSSVFPGPFRALRDAADAGDAAAVERAQAAVDEVVSAVAGDMARMKEVYRRRGIAAGTVRMLIAAPDAEAVNALADAVDRHA